MVAEATIAWMQRVEAFEMGSDGRAEAVEVIGGFSSVGDGATLVTSRQLGEYSGSEVEGSISCSGLTSTAVLC